MGTESRSHNIANYALTERPGKEDCDPVMVSGKSLIDHYPYADVTDAPTTINPQALLKDMGTM